MHPQSNPPRPLSWARASPRLSLPRAHIYAHSPIFADRPRPLHLHCAGSASPRQYRFYAKYLRTGFSWPPPRQRVQNPGGHLPRTGRLHPRQPASRKRTVLPLFPAHSWLVSAVPALARQAGYLYPLRQRTDQKTSSHSERPLPARDQKKSETHYPDICDAYPLRPASHAKTAGHHSWPLFRSDRPKAARPEQVSQRPMSRNRPARHNRPYPASPG